MSFFQDLLNLHSKYNEEMAEIGKNLSVVRQQVMNVIHTAEDPLNLPPAQQGLIAEVTGTIHALHAREKAVMSSVHEAWGAILTSLASPDADDTATAPPAATTTAPATATETESTAEDATETPAQESAEPVQTYSGAPAA